MYVCMHVCTFDVLMYVCMLCKPRKTTVDVRLCHACHVTKLCVRESVWSYCMWGDAMWQSCECVRVLIGLSSVRIRNISEQNWARRGIPACSGNCNLVVGLNPLGCTLWKSIPKGCGPNDWRHFFPGLDPFDRYDRGYFSLRKRLNCFDLRSLATEGAMYFCLFFGMLRRGCLGRHAKLGQRGWRHLKKKLRRRMMTRNTSVKTMLKQLTPAEGSAKLGMQNGKFKSHRCKH